LRRSLIAPAWFRPRVNPVCKTCNELFLENGLENAGGAFG